MNYYIDFDNTLYETAKLTTYMLKAICDTVVEKRGIAYEEIDSYVKEVDSLITAKEKEIMSI